MTNPSNPYCLEIVRIRRIQASLLNVRSNHRLAVEESGVNPLATVHTLTAIKRHLLAAYYGNFTNYSTAI